ncbi:MAG: hypothetical protein BYD32DRAFT_489228 [Podila humilis]|nr:MAG: hypothetical protein BYD32DRAFT_489228 [Podila humilis]
MKFLSAIATLAVLAVTQAVQEGPIPTATAAPTATSTPTPLPLYPISSNCATGYTDQNVTDFSLTPSEYCIGKPYTVTTTGSLSDDIIEGGSLHVIVRYINRIVYAENHDLCTLLAAAGTPCPVAKTTNALSFTFTPKTFLPSGIPFAYQYQATNGNGYNLFCRSNHVEN